MIKLHHLGVIAAFVAILFLGLFVFMKPEPAVLDELTGIWRGGGTNAEGYEWYMLYTFENGTYTLETESSYEEEGTYRIVKRFTDGSMNVEKVFGKDGEKVYEMNVRLTEDSNVLLIEGARLERVE